MSAASAEIRPLIRYCWNYRLCTCLFLESLVISYQLHGSVTLLRFSSSARSHFSVQSFSLNHDPVFSIPRNFFQGSLLLVILPNHSICRNIAQKKISQISLKRWFSSREVSFFRFSSNSIMFYFLFPRNSWIKPIASKSSLSASVVLREGFMTEKLSSILCFSENALQMPRFKYCASLAPLTKERNRWTRRTNCPVSGLPQSLPHILHRPFILPGQLHHLRTQDQAPQCSHSLPRDRPRIPRIR